MDFYTKKWDNSNGVGILVTVTSNNDEPDVDVYKTYDELVEVFGEKKKEIMEEDYSSENIYMKWHCWDTPFIYTDFYSNNCEEYSSEY